MQTTLQGIRAAARLSLLAAAALAALLAVPAVAPATTLDIVGADDATPPLQAWVSDAAVPTVPGRVTVVLGACPGAPAWASACAKPAERTIYLGRQGRDEVTLMHELGHLYDHFMLSRAERERFKQLTGRRGAWSGPASADPPEEQFAEAYAMCAAYSALRTARLGMYGYLASPVRHQKVCGLVRGAAR